MFRPQVRSKAVAPLPRQMNDMLTVHFFACSSRCSVFLRSPSYQPSLRLDIIRSSPNTAPVCPSRTTTTLPIMASGLLSHSIDLCASVGRRSAYPGPLCTTRTGPSTDPSCGSPHSYAHPLSFALEDASTPVYTNNSIASSVFQCTDLECTTPIPTEIPAPLSGECRHLSDFLRRA